MRDIVWEKDLPDEKFAMSVDEEDPIPRKVFREELGRKQTSLLWAPGESNDRIPHGR